MLVQKVRNRSKLQKHKLLTMNHHSFFNLYIVVFRKLTTCSISKSVHIKSCFVGLYVLLVQRNVYRAALCWLQCVEIRSRQQLMSL